MIDATRQDVEQAVDRAKSLVTIKPLPDDMAVAGGPRGCAERPKSLRKIRSQVKRQRLDIAIGALEVDGITWREKARIIHAMGKGSTMVDAICEELNITRTEPCN